MGPDHQTTWKVEGLRIELPAGVATVIGALPFTATDVSTFMLEELPQLPGAPAVELDSTHLGVASVEAEVRAGLIALLSELRGRTEPIVMSLTGPVTVALDLGLDDELVLEGEAYELIHLVNSLRKERGFELTDRIVLTLPETQRELGEGHGDWIAREVLATELRVTGDELKLEKS